VDLGISICVQDLEVLEQQEITDKDVKRIKALLKDELQSQNPARHEPMPLS
jgi:hypothetical protein